MCIRGRKSADALRKKAFRNLFLRKFAGAVDLRAERLQAEGERICVLVQQNTGHMKAFFCPLFRKLLLKPIRKHTRSIRNKDHVGLLEALVVHKAEGFPKRCCIVRVSVQKNLRRPEHIFPAVLSGQKQIRLIMVNAGKVDHGKPALLLHGNIQQGKRHGFAPRGLICRRGRLIQHADDVAASLANRLAALVLLEAFPLKFFQKEGRCG